MDELNTRLRSCFSSSPQFVPSVGGPWLNTQWRAVAQAAPAAEESGVFVHTSGMHPWRTHHSASRRGDRDAYTSEIWTAPTLTRFQAPSTFRWISMTHLLPCGQTPCLSPRSHRFARSAEFAWRRPGHGASEHRCALSRCVSVSDDRGRPLAGQHVSPVAVTVLKFLGQTRSLV